MYSGEYRGHWRGTPHFCCPELNNLKHNGDSGVLKHGNKIDVYAMGVTMSEMAPKLNKRNPWERNFSYLIAEMTCTDPEKRISVSQIRDRIPRLSERTDKFGVLPMSKRAMDMINTVFIDLERSPTKRKTRAKSPVKKTTPRRKHSAPRSSNANPTVSTVNPSITTTQEHVTTSQPTPSTPEHTHAPTMTTPVLPQRPTLPTTTTPVFPQRTTVPVIMVPIVEAEPLRTCKQQVSNKVQKQIREAAERIHRYVNENKKSRGIYKKVCQELKLNMNSNGKYLGSVGEHYKQIQTAVRTLRRRMTNITLTNNTVTKGPTKLQQVTHNRTRTCTHTAALIHTSVYSYIGH